MTQSQIDFIFVFLALVLLSAVITIVRMIFQQWIDEIEKSIVPKDDSKRASAE